MTRKCPECGALTDIPAHLYASLHGPCDYQTVTCPCKGVQFIIQLPAKRFPLWYHNLDLPWQRKGVM